MFGSQDFRDEARPPPCRLLLPSLILLYTGFLISFLPKSINATPQRQQGPRLPPPESEFVPFPPDTNSDTSTFVSNNAASDDFASTTTPDASSASTTPSASASAPTSTPNTASTSDAASTLEVSSTSATDAASTSAPTTPVANIASTPNLSWVIVVAAILFFIGFFTFYCVWRTRRKLHSEKDFDPSRVAPDITTARTKNDPPAMIDLRNSSYPRANQLGSPGSSSEEMVNLRSTSSPESSTEQVANRSTSSLGSSVEQLTNDEGHQSVFTEQTVYGTHAASTSSLDLSTTNYPYLQQHHFMSSDQ